MNLADLKKPFPPDRISWRVGSTTKDKTKGMALAYIDARDVQDRLDEVCGAENWQCRYPHANGKTVCEVGIMVQRGHDLSGPRTEWIWKSDGAGDSDIEAEKGALSDAFKRAAVRWGVGRYLYDLESPWVALDGNRIAQHEYKRLEALLAGTKPPKDPDGQERAWVDMQKDQITKAMSLPVLYEWLAKKAGPGGTISDPELNSQLDKAKKKSPEAYGAVVATFQAQLMTINRKEAAE
jgi:hypothetical protein